MHFVVIPRKFNDQRPEKWLFSERTKKQRVENFRFYKPCIFATVTSYC